MIDLLQGASNKQHCRMSWLADPPGLCFEVFATDSSIAWQPQVFSNTKVFSHGS
jgi:hypothetical protein